MGVVQFDTTKNRFLAAGDDFSIKFWDMDNIQLLTTVDADGGLPVSSLFYCKLKSQAIEISVANSFLVYLQASPRIRFNKDGTLLAVSANDNGIKIVANSDGIRLLRTLENSSMYDASRASELAKVDYIHRCHTFHTSY